MKEVKIPSTVKEIGPSAFSETGLTSIIFVNECPSLIKIGANAFADTQIPDFKLPKSVEEIGERALSGCGTLESVEIGYESALTVLPPFLFEGTRVSSLILGLHLLEVKECALSGCLSLSRIEIASENAELTSKDNIIFDKKGEALIACPNGLEAVTVPAGVSEIRSSAFFGCSKLVELRFAEPSALRLIGKSTFFGCSALQSVTLPGSVEQLLEAAFSGCSALKDLVVPFGSSLCEVGPRSFEGCAQLERITLGNATGLKEIGTSAFEGCESLTSFLIPPSVNSIGSRAFLGCTGLQGVIYCGQYEDIGDSSVFEGCQRVVVFVSGNFTGEFFCGVRPFTVLDGDCSIPTSLFTAGDVSNAVACAIIGSLSLINGDTE